MRNGYIKIGVATPKIKVADTEYNTMAIAKELAKAENLKLEVLVLPELCLTGSTCGDLFFSSALLNGAEKGLNILLDLSQNMETLIFIGLPFQISGFIYNVAVAMCKGKILGIVPKTNLTSSESRYFSVLQKGNITITASGKTVFFGANQLFTCSSMLNLNVAAEIGEDLFSITPPSTNHALCGADIIVNLSAMAETVGSAEYRRNMITSHSSRLCVGYVFANSGNGESTTDMVFSGHNIIAENGKILKETELFENQLIYSEIDLDFLVFERSKKVISQFYDMSYARVMFDIAVNGDDLSRAYDMTPFVPTTEEEQFSRSKLILRMQAEGLKKRMEHTNSKTLIIGLSGGLDSTLALLVSVMTMRLLGKSVGDIIGITMPCFGTTSRTLSNTLNLAKALKITLKKINIEKAVERHLKDIKHSLEDYDVTYENSQARERTQVLMDVANMRGGLVVGTGDLSELALGWATYNGDHMSMYGVNAGVPKTLIRYIIKYYASISKPKLRWILQDVLDTPVSPELLPSVGGEISQKTEDIIGDYLLHDFYLYYLIRKGFSPSKVFMIAERTFKGKYDRATLKKWLISFIKRFFAAQFKRSCLPDGVKIGSVGFSPRGEFNMPSDAVNSLWLKEAEAIRV